MLKNKKTRVAAMIIVGLFAVSAGQQMSGASSATFSVIGSITTIIGAILLIGGIVEAFKKPKQS